MLSYPSPPAETKAAVMQRKRNDAQGWRVHRTLAALGVPRSVYYAWKRRDSLEDRRVVHDHCSEFVNRDVAAVILDLWTSRRDVVGNGTLTALGRTVTDSAVGRAPTS